MALTNSQVIISVILIIFVAAIMFISGIAFGKNDEISLLQQCEINLPRTQKCKIIAITEIEE